MKIIRGLIIDAIVLVALMSIAVSAWAEDRGALHAAALSITSADMKNHVDVLADDTFEGRAMGSRGGYAAGNYIARYMQKFGLQGAGEDGGYFQPFDSGARNVLGLLPGSDPQVSNEVIVLGAHYDHVGYGNSRNSYGPTGYIHNGADDNASGSAGLLEVIEAFHALPQPPRRSVLFAFCDGEEQGLLGSKYWVAHPTIPLDQIKLMFNVDMIGRLRNDRVEVFGSRTSHGLRQLISRANQDIGLDLDFTWELKANSDHYTFFSQNIPVLMFHTGLHNDYHRPSDDADKVNANGMQTVARLMFNVIYDLADRPQSNGFRAASRQESPDAKTRLERSLPPPAPRLGVQWDRNDAGNRGLLLTNITPDSAADRAGLRRGDRMLQFAGDEIADEQQFVAQILAIATPTQVIIERPGRADPMELTITLAGNPVRVGITWREDDAEPGTVLLTQVIPGSAAHRAGLQLRDRIYEIAGRSFQNSEELRQLVTSLPGPLDLLIERQGRLQHVTLDVLPPAIAQANAAN